MANMLGIRNGYRNQFDKILQNATFELNESLSYKDISAKANVKNELTGQYILCVENSESSFIVVDFTEFAEKLRLSDNGTTWNATKGYTPADEEGEQIFNLLMPYAVSEKTTYSHVSVSYLESSAIPGYDLAFAFTIFCFNEATNTYETKGFTVKSYHYSGMSIIESCEKALIDGDYEFTELENKQMLSGDIIFSLDNDDIAYYEINPTAQQ